MKNREELLTEIIDDWHNSDGGTDEEDIIYLAVDSTAYAAAEYIDDAIEKYGHYDVLAKVLKAVRSNVLQLGRVDR